MIWAIVILSVLLAAAVAVIAWQMRHKQDLEGIRLALEHEKERMRAHADESKKRIEDRTENLLGKLDKLGTR